MGLMFARRRLEDKKVRDANKAKAHAENHKAVHAKVKAEAEKDQPAAKAAPNGSDKPGAK